MEKTIWVTVKNVYGKEKIYPHCETAEFFAALANTSTLTPFAIELIKKQGYTVRVHQGVQSL